MQNGTVFFYSLNMTIEQELFAAYRPDKDRLIDYGFDCFNGIYTFTISFHDDEFF